MKFLVVVTPPSIYQRSSHYLVVMLMMIMHNASSNFTNGFLPSSIRGVVPRFYLLRYSEFFYILFEICKSILFVVPRIVIFLPTIIAGDMVKVSFWSF